MKNPIYLGWALLIFGSVTVAQVRGWSLMRVDEVKNVPRSVRDNPGGYRAHYRSSPRYFGGK